MFWCLQLTQEAAESCSGRTGGNCSGEVPGQSVERCRDNLWRGAGTICRERRTGIKVYGSAESVEGAAGHLRRSGQSEHPERSEEHTSELQSRGHLVCRLLLEKKNYEIQTGSMQPMAWDMP